MYQTVLNFWFNELKAVDWFKSDPDLDQLIAQRFGDLFAKATRAELYEWRTSAEGSLAEIIVLDQFSRNLYRSNAQAYSYDGMAIVLAQVAIQKEFDKHLNAAQQSFMYMPFMHSESPEIHDIAVRLFSQPGLEENLVYELQHKAIIDRFGRYPHRNAVLKRISTSEEIEFLKQPNSSF